MRHIKTAVVLIGRSGCGKGKGAEPLRQMGISVLETGALFREMKQQAKHSPSIDCIDSGILVADETVMWQVKLWLTAHKEKMIVLDGAIRTEQQANTIVQELKSRGYQLATFWFNASEQACRNRITKRASETQDGRVDDSTVESIDHKLKAFDQKTLPIKPFMQSPQVSHQFVEVAEDLGVQEVQSLIMHSLGLISNARITSSNQPAVFVAPALARQIFKDEPHPVEP
ncbi:MAG: nucleoside monophosphate kinase [Candidatus Paceibacterota bacterium]